METQYKIDVSIVIVSMNNVRNLNICLDSIQQYTRVNYEVLVVAYLYTYENLTFVRNKYPWVKFIENNEISGFSENNNIALRKAQGKFCFVLNDDTELRSPAIDRLISDLKGLPEEVAVISPVTLNGDLSLQSCGRPKHTMWTFIGGKMRLWSEKKASIYTNQSGVFRSYDIVGAAFLIKTDIFRKFGWFDEHYFFCPEDIALSSTLNKNGLFCYVDADVSLVHYNAGSNKSSTYMRTATVPAAQKGALLFYSSGEKKRLLLLILVIVFCDGSRMIWHYLKSKIGKDKDEKQYHEIYAISFWNSIVSCFSHLSPKEIFIKYYSKIKKYENY